MLVDSETLYMKYILTNPRKCFFIIAPEVDNKISKFYSIPSKDSELSQAKNCNKNKNPLNG